MYMHNDIYWRSEILGHHFSITHLFANVLFNQVGPTKNRFKCSVDWEMRRGTGDLNLKM